MVRDAGEVMNFWVMMSTATTLYLPSLVLSLSPLSSLSLTLKPIPFISAPPRELLLYPFSSPLYIPSLVLLILPLLSSLPKPLTLFSNLLFLHKYSYSSLLFVLLSPMTVEGRERLGEGR